MTVKLKTA